MRAPTSFRCEVIAFIGSVIFAAWLVLNVATAHAETDAKATATSTNDPAADAAWKQVRKASAQPMPPEEWHTTPPTTEQSRNFYTPYVLKGADLARDFYTRFPNHPKAAEARQIEYEMLIVATQQFGDTNEAARVAVLQAKRMDDPSLSEDERFKARLEAVVPLLQELPDKMAETEKAVRALQHDFPKRPESYQVMVMLLSHSEGDKAKAMAQEIIDGPAPDPFKDQAKGLLKRLEAVGKPVDIRFTAVDGREVDLANMKGKVVLVDFWATWCGPCMGELPNVKAAYEKLHARGFEIVGISFDQSKEALNKTLKEKEMTWPQFFDGEGWKNKFGLAYGIESIPTMWLVDKKGNLREVNARGELEAKVTRLLAE